jgi:carnitine O-acetyltransferase
MDGTPTLRMNEFMLASIAANKINLGPPRTSETGSALPEPKELKFILGDKSKTNIREAEARFDELVSKHDLHVIRIPISRTLQLTYAIPGPPLRSLW